MSRSPTAQPDVDREKGVIPIARAMLSHYISSVLEVVMLDEPHAIDRPGSISDPIFRQRYQSAAWFGEAEQLRLGIEYLLANPDVDSSTLVWGSEWGWDDEDVRPVLHEMHCRLWAGDFLAEEQLARVVLTDEPIEEWRARYPPRGEGE